MHEPVFPAVTGVVLVVIVPVIMFVDGWMVEGNYNFTLSNVNRLPETICVSTQLLFAR